MKHKQCTTKELFTCLSSSKQLMDSQLDYPDNVLDIEF